MKFLRKRLDLGLLLLLFLTTVACTHTPVIERSIATAASCEIVFAELRPQTAKRGLNVQDAKSLVTKNRLQESAWMLRQIGEIKSAKTIEANIERDLQNSPVLKIEPFKTDGTNVSELYLVTLKSGLKAVFKPEAQFWKEKDQRHGIIANPNSEALAYRFGQFLNMNEVPVTVLREIDGMKGSLQVFVELGGTNYTYAEMQDPSLRKWLWDVSDAPRELHSKKVGLFDYLIYNMDRHIGNLPSWAMADRLDPRVLVGQGSGIVAIDNGAAFQPQNTARGNTPPKTAWSLGIKDIQSFVPFFEALKTQLTPEKIRELMKDHFEDSVIEETIQRRQFLLKFYEERTRQN